MHTKRTLELVATYALAEVARRNHGTEQGEIAAEMLAKHQANIAAATLAHAGVSYPHTAGRA